MLEEEFVPYNLAKQIKQLGFKQECFGYYIDVEVPSPFLVKNTISDDQGGYFTLAPTFSQAFRFFREKYGIFSSIWIFETEQKFFIEFGFGIQKFEVINKEEAELECLKKLIELCKK